MPKSKKDKNPRGLDDREKLFVSEYLIDLDAKRAAIAAGYSATVAKSKAYQWVSNGKSKPHLFAAVQAKLEKKVRTIEEKKARVEREMEKLGFSDARCLFNDDGTPIPITELDDGIAGAIAGIKVRREAAKESGESGEAVVMEYKLADKKGALDSLAKYYGMFIDKHENIGPPQNPTVIQSQIILNAMTLEQLEQIKLELQKQQENDVTPDHDG